MCPQCSPFTHHVPLLCNCYSADLRSNFYNLKETSVQFKEKLDEVKKINETKSSSSNNFNTTAQKNSLKNKTTSENGECSIDILDERERKKSSDVEMKVFKIIKKGTNFFLKSINQFLFLI